MQRLRPPSSRQADSLARKKGAQTAAGVTKIQNFSDQNKREQDAKKSHGITGIVHKASGKGKSKRR